MKKAVAKLQRQGTGRRKKEAGRRTEKGGEMESREQEVEIFYRFIGKID